MKNVFLIQIFTVIPLVCLAHASSKWTEDFNQYPHDTYFVDGQTGWVATHEISGSTISRIAEEAESPFTRAPNGKGWHFSKPDGFDQGGGYGAWQEFDPIPVPATLSFDYQIINLGRDNLNPVIFLYGRDETGAWDRALYLNLSAPDRQPRNLSTRGVQGERWADVEPGKWYRVIIQIGIPGPGEFTISRQALGKELEILGSGILEAPIVELDRIEVRAGFNDSPEITGEIMFDNLSIAPGKFESE